jgi:Ca2+-binding RTX toxin-like protein
MEGLNTEDLFGTGTITSFALGTGVIGITAGNTRLLEVSGTPSPTNYSGTLASITIIAGSSAGLNIRFDTPLPVAWDNQEQLATFLLGITLASNPNAPAVYLATNDIFKGQDGNDLLKSYDGDDTLDGGIGVDTLVGGRGNDTYVVDNVLDVVTELGGEGTDTIQSTVSLALSVEVENLTLTGTAAINGTGNLLNNVLTGNEANNILTGGLGVDTLIGGAGADIFDFNLATESKKGALRDVVYFSHAEKDKVDLKGIDAVKGKGNQAFHWADEDQLNAKFTDEAGELRFANKVLSGDINGDGKADFEIKIFGKFTADDVFM